jgi:hypothetical protein
VIGVRIKAELSLPPYNIIIIKPSYYALILLIVASQLLDELPMLILSAFILFAL